MRVCVYREAGTPQEQMPAKRRPDAQLQRALDAPTRPDPGDAVGGGGGAAAVALRWAGMQDDWVSSWNESFHTPPSDRRRAWWKMQKKEHSKLLVEAAARGLIPGGGDDGDDGVSALSGALGSALVLGGGPTAPAPASTATASAPGSTQVRGSFGRSLVARSLVARSLE